MMEIPSCFVGNSTFAQALHDMLMEVLACIDGIFNFALALLHCILTSETTQSFMMKTGNDVLTDFTGFVSLHCDKALNARGLHTYACTDGKDLRGCTCSHQHPVSSQPST